MAEQSHTMNPTEIKDLPFVKDGPRGKPRNFWAVEPTGDSRSNSRFGQECAIAFLRNARDRDRGDFPLLGLVARAIAKSDGSDEMQTIVIAFYEILGYAIRDACEYPKYVERMAEWAEDRHDRVNEIIADEGAAS